MAADTAYLQGGPCDGETKKISAAESDSGTIVCKGAEYLNNDGQQRPNGDIIFLYRAEKTPGLGDGSSGSGVKDSHALAGWADLRKSMNRTLPASLTDSQNTTRAALRHLGRARKVKG